MRPCPNGAVGARHHPAHIQGMTEHDAARESVRQNDGRFGEQHRPDGVLTLRLPDSDSVPACGNCGGTIHDGYCNDCDRRTDWVSDHCQDCGRNLNEDEASRGWCDDCATNVGNDGLTHTQRAEYAEAYRNGPGSKHFTTEERAIVTKWQEGQQAKIDRANIAAAAAREDAKIRAEYNAWKATVTDPFLRGLLDNEDDTDEFRAEARNNRY